MASTRTAPNDGLGPVQRPRRSYAVLTLSAAVSFNPIITPNEIAAVAACLKEGCGIRNTARLTGGSKDGVTAMAIQT